MVLVAEVEVYLSFFFLLSRIRHTMFDCDWSSDVCSSDLCCGPKPGNPPIPIDGTGKKIGSAIKFKPLLLSITPLLSTSESGFGVARWFCRLKLARASLIKEIGRASCRERV